MESVSSNPDVKRIALFIPSLRGGGAERVMVSLARNMVRRGHAIDLVVANAEGPYLREVPDSVRLVDLRAPRIILSLKGLRSYLQKERPDALLSTMYHANIVALLAARWSGVAMRTVVREANILHTPHRGRVPLKSRILLRLMPLFYRWSDGVVAVSEGVAQDLEQCGAGVAAKVKVIHNPVVDDDLFKRARQPLDHGWFGSGSPPVVLAAGRLVPQKDFTTLIEAFFRVRKSRKCRLMILGEGPERKTLEDLVQSLGLADDVQLPGFVQNPFPFMAGSAAFVLSSKWEGLPNTLIQAAALGTPVVATDCHSGPREILQDGRWGKLVPVGDAAAMALAIGECLTTDSREVCPQAFSRRYAADTVTDAYLDLLLRA